MLKLMVCLMFVLAAFSNDTTSPCVPTNGTEIFNSMCGGSNATVLEENTWTDVTQPTNSSSCFSYNATSPESTDVFVLALRPGGDSAGPFYQVTANAFDDSGTSFGCAAIQQGQEKNDMDFHCYNISVISESTAYVTTTNPNVTAAATFQIFVGFSEGTVQSCSASNVDAGGGYWFYVIIGVVVLVVIVLIVVAIGGFVYMKKKKAASSYDIYEEA